jgi:hypothetical protein
MDGNVIVVSAQNLTDNAADGLYPLTGFASDPNGYIDSHEEVLLALSLINFSTIQSRKRSIISRFADAFSLFKVSVTQNRMLLQS